MRTQQSNANQHTARSKWGSLRCFQPSILLALLAAGMMMLAGTARGQTEYFVATNGADTGNHGTNWSQPLLTISNAIAKATTGGDIVTVSNGTYNITAEIALSQAITVRSFGNGVTGGLANAAATIVKGPASAASTVRIFNITGNAPWTASRHGTASKWETTFRAAECPLPPAERL